MLTKKVCEWPALTSVLFTTIISSSLVYCETSIGAKISGLSLTQIVLILFVICIVAKNVIIPSRANRFLENAVPSNSISSPEQQTQQAAKQS